MAKRIYDPIHDVFQDTGDNEPKRSKVLSVSELNSSETSRRNVSSISSLLTSDDQTAEKAIPERAHRNSISNLLSNDPEEDNNAEKEKVVPVPHMTNTKYTRHLKKPDGDFFSRKDIQYDMLKALLTDDRCLFTNHLKAQYTNSLAPMSLPNNKIPIITDKEYDARTFVFNDKLTFAQMYALTMATSSKCSKILRDKLLLDGQVAFSTCVLGFLVNIGRLNTTINFYLEMTSQLRTYHSVPCLQAHTLDIKSLQDTPRIKSILRNLPTGNNPIHLSLIYKLLGVISEEKFNEIGDSASQKLDKQVSSAEKFGLNGKFNCINMLFALCDNATIVRTQFLSKYIQLIDPQDNNHRFDLDKDLTLFNILDNSKFDVIDRVNVVLWLLYIHTETDLTEAEVVESLKLFIPPTSVPDLQHNKIPLRLTTNNYDVDTEEELKYGKEQKEKRLLFLQKLDKSDTRKEEKTSTADSKDDDSITERATRRKRKKTLEKEILLESSKPNKKIKKEEETEDRVKVEPEQDQEALKTAKEKPEAPLLAAERTPDVKKSKESIHQDRADRLINFDQNKEVGILEKSRERKTQRELLQDLSDAQEIVKRKRKQIGMLRLFNKYDDIPMGSVIGVRGKKRRKYKDDVLGYETSFLKTLAIAKQKFIKALRSADTKPQQSENNIFHL